MLMKVKITTAAPPLRCGDATVAAATMAAAAKWSTLTSLLAPSVASLAYAAALLAVILLYFHDSNEVVIHFSVKLMMLQISSTYLKDKDDVLINID